MYDVIVIGGGPAGLQAALTLGRVHRSVLVLDSGDYRNERATHMHNFLTHDGTPPEEFRTVARKELAAYDDVELRSATVREVSPIDGGFRLGLGPDGVEESRKLVLATGLRDELPDLPGLAEAWGVSAFACPFCHGHELSGRPVALMLPAAHGVTLAHLLSRIASEVTLLTDPTTLDSCQVEGLARAGISLRGEEVRRLVPHADGLRVDFEETSLEVAGLFTGGELRQSAPFAEQLGLTLLASGCIEVDDFQKTSLPGVFAAGDLAHRPGLPMPMASVLGSAAAGQVAGAVAAQELTAEDMQP